MSDAVMNAIERMLRKPLPARLMNALGIRPLKRIPIENRVALRTLRRHMAGHDIDKKALESALQTVMLRVRPSVGPSSYLDDWFDDDFDSPPTIDEGEADAARAAARRGHTDDALHHLERALPADYAEIAERLAIAFRSRT